MTAVEIIDAEVRELIRREGVDPMREPAVVRRIVDEVLADYADRALTGALPVVADPVAAARAVVDSVAGFGPLQRYFDDPEVEEIWINGPGRVFVARRGRSELTNAILSAEAIRELVERMLKHSGRRVDLSTPFVDAMLPDGSRLHVVIPDVTREHWAVNIRKFVLRAHGLDQLVALGSLTPHAARFLEASVAAGLNILVSGGTQAGKTTLLNCLAASIPGSERVVSCEEVFELRLGLPDWVAMQTRQPNLEGTGEIPLRRLVTEALRMRPSRIIVGEVRQAESLDLLIALNAGLPGMCSIHANSARAAITKLCTLPLLAGENVSASFVVPTVASSVDLVVHTETETSGQRRVREIVAVPGRVEGTVVEAADVFATRLGRLVRADGYPPYPERYAAVGYDLPALLAAAGPHAGPNGSARAVLPVATTVAPPARALNPVSNPTPARGRHDPAPADARAGAVPDPLSDPTAALPRPTFNAAPEPVAPAAPTPPSAGPPSVRPPAVWPPVARAPVARPPAVRPPAVWPPAVRPSFPPTARGPAGPSSGSAPPPSAPVPEPTTTPRFPDQHSRRTDTRETSWVRPGPAARPAPDPGEERG